MVFASGFRRPVRALDGFSMDIPQGSVVGLLGPNGSGKTTALSCLLGLLRPQCGEILLFGEKLGSDLPSEDRKRVGVLLEDTRLPPFLSVRAALRTVCRLRGLAGARLSIELDRVVDESGTEPLLSRKVSVLSKGQARRVGLAAALVGDPPLLILDEPSAGLDVSAREEFNELVRALRGKTRTVIIASHLLSDIERTCTHVALVRDGRVLAMDTSERLLTEAREGHAEKDIHVEARFRADLDRLGARYEESSYPGLVRLLVTEPEHELIERLARERIVPTRIEPRVTLVSIYIDIMGKE